MATRKKNPSGQAPDVVPTPTVTIYQHGEHVAGVVQQFFDRPLVTEESLENEATTSEGKNSEHAADAKVSGEAKAPWIASLTGGAGYRYTRGSDEASATTTRARQNFVYSQAYYLNLIRSELREAGILRSVTSLKDAKALEVGSFVEYKAEFRPSEVTTLMDVITPEIVETFTRSRHIMSETALFMEWDSIEAVQKAALKAEAEAKARGEIAGAITRAVKTDFRNTTTREYFGTIGADDSAVTAVTICDTAHFTVDDEDRILDGVFTVLGKVTSKLETDAPLLRRNKLLSRIEAKGFDALTKLITDTSKTIDTGKSPLKGSHLDLSFSSRVEGESFRVVPLAIYV